MTTTGSTGSRGRRRAARAAIAACAAACCAVPWATPAQALGTTIDPATRNYGCWLRWADDWQNPAMAAEDPMCLQVFQDDPQAVWQWDGVYRDGPTPPPDGHLCSAGQAAGGRYDSLDLPGPWRTTPIADPNGNFSVRVHDLLRDGADLIWIWVTEPGFDPTTQPLTWDDLVLERTEGSFEPDWGAPSPEPHLPGGTYEVVVSAPGRSGHHVVVTQFALTGQERSHWLCSDVDFG
ncbi:lytic polysaccharide monooxygenase [Streptomyces hoynatensis]|uniref:Cellulose-binding protein n=1 Tax=Streptomyces hoynatensis TaxID=1141874 RepID=A0A3A9Z9F0_9ACTN|nr:lytic polysaccharide monooxygenase [Streptomyces hoynatensis]RKN44883.1 cellulose-binding protein [Streptomyces hoynatensis]